MAIYFSPSVGGFFHDDLHGGAMPPDVVVISKAEFDELFRQQAQGMIIRTVNGRPVAQRPPDPTPSAPVMQSLEFRNRFTAAEKGRMTLAASQGLERGDPTLQVFIDDLNSAGTVHLDDPRIVQGVEYLVAQNLLSPRRGDEILGR